MSTAPRPHGPGLSCPHAVQFFSEDEPMVDGVADLVQAALDRGDAAVCVMTKPHHAILSRRLLARGPGAMQALSDGRFLALPAEDTLARLEQDGELRWELFSAIIGGGVARARSATGNQNAKVVAVGEMVGVLWAQGRTAEVILLEDMWNELGHTQEFSLLCCYPMAGFDQAGDEEPFLKICSQHTSVVPSETYPAAGSEDEKHRAVAALQQTVMSLRREVAELRLHELWNTSIHEDHTPAPTQLTESAKDQTVETQAELVFRPNEVRAVEEDPPRRPDWQPVYEAAVLESDLSRLSERVEEAEARILERLDQLQHHATESRECRDLMYAWGVIRLIRRRKLSFLQ